MLQGSRLWYAMWDVEKDDDAAFEHRLDVVVREIGTRGKRMVPGNVETLRVPRTVPAPAPISPPAPAQAPAPAPAPSPDRISASPPATGCTPSMPAVSQALQKQNKHVHASPLLEGKISSSFADVAAFFREERAYMEAKFEQQRQETNQQWKEYEQKVEQQRQQIEQLQAKLATRPQLAVEAIEEEQLAAFQLRLQSMHEAKWLNDEELLSLEDMIVDCIEVMPTADVSMTAVEKVAKILLLESKIASDSTLARQLRRKFKLGRSE